MGKNECNVDGTSVSIAMKLWLQFILSLSKDTLVLKHLDASFRISANSWLNLKEGYGGVRNLYTIILLLFKQEFNKKLNRRNRRDGSCRRHDDVRVWVILKFRLIRVRHFELRQFNVQLSLSLRRGEKSQNNKAVFDEVRFQQNLNLRNRRDVSYRRHDGVKGWVILKFRLIRVRHFELRQFNFWFSLCLRRGEKSLKNYSVSI